MQSGITEIRLPVLYGRGDAVIRGAARLSKGSRKGAIRSRLKAPPSPFLYSAGFLSHIGTKHAHIYATRLRNTLLTRTKNHGGAPQKYKCSFTNCIEAAEGSAAGLVNLLARDFACFRDEFPTRARRQPVRFLKRAQILVADLWACFGGESYGAFRDVEKITTFTDYRVPQILASLGCLAYSPPLLSMVQKGRLLDSGSNYELQIRG